MKNTVTITTIIIFAILPLNNINAQQTPPPQPAQELPEVLTSGPVHEAYAEPVNLQIQEGLVVPIQPPANLNEIPPNEKPQGDNYYWVPGYWAWDTDRNNYIWVSGCWRQAPPNTYWVPGYWARVSDGWEWVAGFWAPIGTQEIEYLPQPPAISYTEPVNPPSSDFIWVPPCWYWNQNQYVLRSGYWLAAQSNWIWIPSHYIWTPRGYAFVAGHWDYPLESRGVLFSPVYFPHSVYIQAGFSYSPSIVVNIGALSVSLFSYPRYCHYFFGDYYSDSYIRVGIYPWFEFERYHTWYDPIYKYNRWHHRVIEPRWADRQREQYDRRRQDANLRPSKTYRQMETRLAKMPEQQRKDFRTAEPLSSAAVNKTSPQKFQRVNTKTQQNITTQSRAVHKFGEERNRWESSPATTKTTPSATVQKSTEVQTQRTQTQPAPSERKETIQRQTQTKTSAAPQTQTSYVPPRQVNISRPERVKVSPPIVERSETRGKSTPPQPTSEQKSTSSSGAPQNQGRRR